MLDVGHETNPPCWNTFPIILLVYCISPTQIPKAIIRTHWAQERPPSSYRTGLPWPDWGPPLRLVRNGISVYTTPAQSALSTKLVFCIFFFLSYWTRHAQCLKFPTWLQLGLNLNRPNRTTKLALILFPTVQRRLKANKAMSLFIR